MLEKDKNIGENIRNFVIIAHIDHGKSTLADRFLEFTGTLPLNKIQPQHLDRMNLERKHGITIKMHPVRMLCEHPQIQNSKFKVQKDLEIMNWESGISGSKYILNLIDTPGHVDFSYEVSRALAAVEGAILLVDASQGIQAQTLSHLHFAKKQGLKIIGALNKIDLDVYDLNIKIKEVAESLGVKEEEIVLVSGKTGQNIECLLSRIIKEVPPPETKINVPFRALIFDSQYDYYRGIIAYLRVFEGEIKKGEKIKLIANKCEAEVVGLGYFSPELKEKETLASGEIGWIATGLKDPNKVLVGDTIIVSSDEKTGVSIEPLPGYKEPLAMVYAGFYPAGKGDDFENFRSALLKLKLNDYALQFSLENSEILGRGYRLGLLGALHLKITSERLKEEYDLDLIVTNPTVSYHLWLRGGKEPRIINNPNEWPSPEKIVKIKEPWAKIEIITPPQYLANVLQLINQSRGLNIETHTIVDRLLINCDLPLEETIKNFYDNLKSVSSGYASMDYEIGDYREVELEKLEVILAGKKFESLSRITIKEKAENEARNLALKLKDLLPRQNYAVPIQIVGFGRIIARETLPSLKKDVTGHLYGGDRTRKMKLWEKQKKGKKKLLEKANLEVPSDVFLKLFSKE